MAKIELEIPEEWEKRARKFNIALSILAMKALKEKIERLEEIERFKRIVVKSQATEEDVEEISNEIKEAVWKHHKNKYGL